MKDLLIRADATSRMGAGHVMRCLALAQSWQEQCGSVTWIGCLESDELRERIVSEGIPFFSLSRPYPNSGDLSLTLQIMEKYRSSLSENWIVVDGYHFDGEYQKALREKGLSLLFIDDYGHAGHYHADIVLNQNLSATSSLYPERKKNCCLLLGPRYALLRREFLAWRGTERRTRETGERVLITLGGSDPDNVSLKVLAALEGMRNPNVKGTIIIGPANPNREMIREAVQKSSIPFQVLFAPLNMSDLMAAADVAISAGGSTLWELAYMGLPNVILILAENQRENAERLHEEGVSINLGWHGKVNPRQIAETLEELIRSRNQREKMSAQGRRLVDGDGGRRTIQAMMFYPLHLRPVGEEDRERIWRWGNDPDVRGFSFSKESIPWEDHIRWFRAKVNEANPFFYIGENAEGISVGSIRFDQKNREIAASVLIDRQFRGQGYGSRLIKMGTQEYFCGSDEKAIHAYVKSGNLASQRAFEKAGFRRAESQIINGQAAAHFIMERDR